MSDANESRSKDLQMAVFVRADGRFFATFGRPVGPLTSRWPLLCAAVAAGVLVTGSTAASGGTASTPSLAAQADALRRSESGALLELYAAESAAARAQSALAGLQARSAALSRAEQSARQRTEIVRRSLEASQARVAALLRDLYVQGDPDPIAVILGATSLDEAVTGIEELARATAQNERLGTEARERARRLQHLSADLALQRQSLDRARAAARAGARQLASAVAARKATVASIRLRRSLTVQRLAAMQAQARAAEQRSANLTQAAGAGTAEAAATTPPATLTTRGTVTRSRTTSPATPRAASPSASA
jgi:septal ring factor EnvC (AmiA/AmiB activator)